MRKLRAGLSGKRHRKGLTSHLAIKVYSTPTCPFCRQAKGFLAELGIDFEDIDVSTDRDAAKDFIAKTGQTGVPVLDISGKLIFGFDKEKIRSALDIK